MMTSHEFARLVDSQGPALTLYARQWCITPEDVVPDALLKLVQARPTPGDPVAWLYRVVKNAAIDAGRSERRRQRRESAVLPGRWFVEPEIDGLDAAAAVATLERLPGEQREV